MDWRTSDKLRKPKEYKHIAQLPVGEVESGWGQPVMVPKGALHELETKYRALMLEAHELKREVRKLLKESTASNGKRNARKAWMKGVGRHGSKKRKPLVEACGPQASFSTTIWEVSLVSKQNGVRPPGGVLCIRKGVHPPHAGPG
jgi:hypothetical protein